MTATDASHAATAAAGREPAAADALTLWGFNHLAGAWRPERSDILPEDRAACLRAYQESEPLRTFAFSKRKPRRAPPARECHRIRT